MARAEVPSASIALSSALVQLEPGAARLHPGLQTLPGFVRRWKMMNGGASEGTGAPP